MQKQMLKTLRSARYTERMMEIHYKCRENYTELLTQFNANQCDHVAFIQCNIYNSLVNILHTSVHEISKRQQKYLMRKEIIRRMKKENKFERISCIPLYEKYQ